MTFKIRTRWRDADGPAIIIHRTNERLPLLDSQHYLFSFSLEGETGRAAKKTKTTANDAKGGAVDTPIQADDGPAGDSQKKRSKRTKAPSIDIDEEIMDIPWAWEGILALVPTANGRLLVYAVREVQSFLGGDVYPIPAVPPEAQPQSATVSLGVHRGAVMPQQDSERNAPAAAISPGGGGDSRSVPALHSALYLRQFGAIQDLLGPSTINSRDVFGRTPLHWAIISGCPPLVEELLVKAGADPLLRDAWGCTPNVYRPAAASASPPPVVSTDTPVHRAALLHAIYLGDHLLAEQLIDAGHDLEVRGAHGTTALIEAVKRGQITLCEKLREAGASPDSRDYSGKSAYDYARMLGPTGRMFLASRRGALHTPPSCTAQGSDLSEADLQYADLSGANLVAFALPKLLSHAVLRNCDLRRTDLSAADLSYSDLSGALLAEAKLPRSLRGVKLCGCDLSGRDLSETDLWEADLSGTVLREAKLPRCLRATKLCGCDLNGHDLSGSDLRHADLSGAAVATVSLPKNLRWTLLRNCDLRNHSLAGADLRNADLTSAVLMGARFGNANLAHACLRNARLEDTNLAQAKLRGADLSAADLRRARLPKDLTNVRMRGSDLRGVNLSHACLVGADLSGAQLAGANLSSSDLSSATLSGATGFEAADVSEAVLENTVWPFPSLKLLAARAVPADLLAVSRLPRELRAYADLAQQPGSCLP